MLVVLLIGAVAVSLLVITALFVGLTGPPEAPTADTQATSAPAAQPPPAVPVLSAPEPAAEPAPSSSSAAASSAKKKGKLPASGSTSPQPAFPKASPAVGGDGTPLHL